VNPNLEAALRLVVHLLTQNSPRVGTGHTSWFHMCVDASFEPEGFSGIGAAVGP